VRNGINYYGRRMQLARGRRLIAQMFAMQADLPALLGR